MGRYGVEWEDGAKPPTRDAIGGPQVAVALLTIAALAISAWLLESLISVLVPAMEGEVTESDQ